jgi:CelD/BcsL family acetyltransferase involved in cellulose biosynthesis
MAVFPPSTDHESPFRLEIVRGGCLLPQLRADWQSLTEATKDPEPLHQSLDFFDYLNAHDPGERIALATVRDNTRTLAGVVPLRIRRSPLVYQVRERVLCEVGLQGVEIVGGPPRIPEDVAVFDSLFKTMDEMFSDCDLLSVTNIPTSSLLWLYLNRSDYIKDKFLIHNLTGVNLFHTIELPSTFQEYMARYKTKARYNINRQIRHLREFGGGKLELRKIDSKDQIPDLLAFAAMLDQPSDSLGELAHRRAELANLAERGFLLDYVLICGDTPCAAAFGEIYKGTYAIDRFARNRAFDRFSPGTDILHLLIEDLIRGGRVKLVELGIGAPRYRHSSTNLTRQCASVYLLRKTMNHRLLRISHRAFRVAKRWLARRSPRGLEQGSRGGGSDGDQSLVAS